MNSILLIKIAKFCENNNDFIKMKKYYKIAIQKYNSVDAMIYLGDFYTTNKNNKKIIKYYLMASKYKNSCAMYKLGLYFNKINHFDNMIKYLKMAIRYYNVDAMIFMGNISVFDKKILYYSMAIKHNSVEAMFKLGKYYDDLQIINKHSNIISNMLKYYIMACNLGNTDAMYYLGLYYKKNFNYQNMLKYFIMGANLNDYNCIFELGEYYTKNNNCEELLKYLNIKNKNNYCLIITFITKYYEKNKIHDKMIFYLELGIKNKCTISIYNMAKYYEQNKDYINMIKYYIMGVELNHFDSMYELGKYYETNDDIKNAKKYYKILVNYTNNHIDEWEIIDNIYIISYIHYFLGNYYLKKNKINKMIFHFHESFDKDTDSNAIFPLLEYYKENNNIDKYLSIVFEYQTFYIENYINDIFSSDKYNIDKYIKIILNINKHFDKLYQFYINHNYTSKFYVLYCILIYIYDTHFNISDDTQNTLNTIIYNNYYFHKNNYKNIVKILFKLYKNYLKIYSLFENANIIIHIDNPQVKYYTQNKFLNIIDDPTNDDNEKNNCKVCYDIIKIGITFQKCKHIVCNQCYVKMNKCYYNCK